ncbi:MAG: TonB-dependent receptor domain-containing protein [Cyanophyceae cyanobacterium]
MVREYSSNGWYVASTVIAVAIAQPVVGQEPSLVQELEEFGSQQAQASVTQITGVQWEATETGLNLILKTPEGTLDIPPTSVLGNALIVDIPNATLNLPNGEDFQIANPIEGIARISVSGFPDNGVRVAITGLNAPPVVAVNADTQGLAIAIAPDSPIADAPAPTGDSALRIIVTAEKRPEDLQDVPLGVTALTEQDIEDADITSLEEISRNTPNFSFFPSGNRFFSLYSIRGISNGSSLANRDPIDFYIDGVPTGLVAFTNLDLPDLERVEILRGPQSVLYGRNALAGVVNIITRKPTNEFEVTGSGQYGNFDDLDFRASVSGPIIDDELFFRLSGSYGSRDGYVRNTFLDQDIDYQSGWTGRAQLRWVPSEEWDILLNASFDDYDEGGPPYVVLDQSDPFESEQDFDGFNELTSDSQSLRVAYTHLNFRITSVTVRRFSRTGFEFDGDASTLDGLLRTTGEANTSVFSQELLLQSPEDVDKFQWTAGAYFESNQLNQSDNGIEFGADVALLGFPFPAGASSLGDVETDTTTFALFGQVSYQPTEALTLTAGLRYESTRSTLESFERVLRMPGSPPSSLLSLEDIEQNNSELLPSFIAQYRFNPNLMVYGSITRGYRPPGINLAPSTEETATFKAERSWNYEIGLKSSWLDNRLGINLAVFHNPVENFQVLTFDDLLGAVVENADVSITGAELELRATPLDGLDIIAGLGYVNAEFTDYPGNDDFVGNKLTYAPDLTYNLAVQYRSPIGIFGRVELQGVGVTYFEADNSAKQDPYAVVNARLGYEAENYGIYLFANNIFDTEYVNQAFAFPPLGTLGIYGAPGTYGIQFKARL